ncbi:MAG: tetratricopeptide repeat protein [Pseudomonadota bacterium]
MARLEEEQLEQIARIVDLVLQRREEEQSAQKSRTNRMFDLMLEHWGATTVVFALAALLAASLFYGASPFFYVKKLAIEDAEVSAKQEKHAYEANLARRYHQLGLRLLDQGLWTAADLEFKRAEQLDPNNLQIALARRNVAIFKEVPADEYDPALVELRLLHFFNDRSEEEADKPPLISDPHALARLGDIYRLNQDARKARARYESALRKRPQLAHAHAGLAQLSLDQKDYPGAFRHYEKALELSPSNSVYLANLGSAFLESGDAGKAIPVLRRAIALDPNLLVPYLDLARAFRHKRDHRQSWRIMKYLLSSFDQAALFKPEGKNARLWVFAIGDRQFLLATTAAKTAYIHASSALSAHLAGRRNAAEEVAGRISWAPGHEFDVRSAVEAEALQLLKGQPEHEERIRAFFKLPTYARAQR